MNPGFDSSIYSRMITLVKDNLLTFKFSTNPFLPEQNSKLIDEQKELLVDKFAKSYF